MIKIFADGADAVKMLENRKRGVVSGFTTNPTLMRKAGVLKYREFARLVLEQIPDMPISFEVFSDDFVWMERDAEEIASWGKNVYVKIPIQTTKGEYTLSVLKNLSNQGIKVNVTAILTNSQVRRAVSSLNDDVPAIISVFAGRIADTGVDPMPIMREAVFSTHSASDNFECLWASCREVLNIKQAEQCGCDIITVPNDILKKMEMFGKDLNELSLETVQMFYDDAKAAGYSIW